MHRSSWSLTELRSFLFGLLDAQQLPLASVLQLPLLLLRVVHYTWKTGREVCQYALALMKWSKNKMGRGALYNEQRWAQYLTQSLNTNTLKESVFPAGTMLTWTLGWDIMFKGPFKETQLISFWAEKQKSSYWQWARWAERRHLAWPPQTGCTGSSMGSSARVDLVFNQRHRQCDKLNILFNGKGKTAAQRSHQCVPLSLWKECLVDSAVAGRKPSKFN